MTTMQRVRVPWAGVVGGTSLSTFYFTDASAGLADLRAFFASFAVVVPAGISWSFPGAGDVMEDTTGEITGTWTGTGQALLQGSGGGNYAAPTGLMARWTTPSVVFGHRVRGRTFLVPMTNNGFDAGGTGNDSVVAAIQLAGQTLADNATADMKIWSRPQLATPSWTDVRGVTHPARPARSGVAVSATGCFVPDKAVVLRSRRD